MNFTEEKIAVSSFPFYIIQQITKMEITEVVYSLRRTDEKNNSNYISWNTI